MSAFVSFVLAFFEEDAHEQGIRAFIEPAVIVLILILNAAVGVWQESNAEAALDALKELQTDSAEVVRNGKTVSPGGGGGGGGCILSPCAGSIQGVCRHAHPHACRCHAQAQGLVHVHGKHGVMMRCVSLVAITHVGVPPAVVHGAIYIQPAALCVVRAPTPWPPRSPLWGMRAHEVTSHAS